MEQTLAGGSHHCMEQTLALVNLLLVRREDGKNRAVGGGIKVVESGSRFIFATEKTL
jgi:hypothetical protein